MDPVLVRSAPPFSLHTGGSASPMVRLRRTLAARVAAAALLVAGVAVAGVVVFVAAPTTTAGAASLGRLNSQLGAQQARQQSLGSSLSRLSSLIGSLNSQISLVESREAAVRAELAHDQSALDAAHTALVRERARLKLLRARLAWARVLLSRQLVSSYETDRPDLVSVVLNAHGFTDLLESLDFLHRAEQQQNDDDLTHPDGEGTCDDRRAPAREA